jgi:hypothetical protein
MTAVVMCDCGRSATSGWVFWRSPLVTAAPELLHTEEVS